MFIQFTDRFQDWLDDLKDRQGRIHILKRINRCRIADRPVGDINSVGGGVLEMRIKHGPGYRVYFAQKGDILMLLLIGGDKSSQQKDIRTAQALLAEMEEEDQW